MRLGPSPVLRVRGGDPRLAFRGPWSGAPAAVQLAPVPAFNGGVLAHPATSGLCAASVPRPIRPETRCMASFNESYVVNYF